MIFGMIAGFAIIAHWMAIRNVSAAKMSRRFPDEMFAENPFAIRYTVKTDRRPWGAGGLIVREQSPLSGEDEGVALPHVHPGVTMQKSGIFSIQSRGDHTVPAAVVSSSFPFGVAVYARECCLPESVLVFPKIEPVDADIPAWLGESGRRKERVDPFGSVPFQFRQYIPGDPHKHIDWKKTARTGEFITRVLSDEVASEIVIRLPKEASERTISRAASLVVRFAGSGIPIGLQGPGLMVETGSGQEHGRRLLTILARWQDTPGVKAMPERSGATVVEVDESGGFNWRTPGK